MTLAFAADVDMQTPDYLLIQDAHLQCEVGRPTRPSKGIRRGSTVQRRQDRLASRLYRLEERSKAGVSFLSDIRRLEDVIQAEAASQGGTG